MALATNFIAGQASVTVNGRSYLLVGELSYRISDNSVETMKGMDGIHGPKGTPEPGMIKFKGRDNGAVPMSVLSNITSGSIVAQLANGKTVNGDGMWRSGEPIEVSAEDATFEITFEGADVSDG